MGDIGVGRFLWGWLVDFRFLYYKGNISGVSYAPDSNSIKYPDFRKKSISQKTFLEPWYTRPDKYI